MGRSTLDHRLISTQKLTIQKIFKMKIVQSLAFGLFAAGSASPMVPLPFESKNFQSAIQSDGICARQAFNASTDEVVWQQCYYDDNGYYGITASKGTWDDAVEKCEKAGGQLLSFTDSATSKNADEDKDYCAYTVLSDAGYKGEILLFSGRPESRSQDTANENWLWCPEVSATESVTPNKCNSQFFPSPIQQQNGDSNGDKYSNWKLDNSDKRKGDYMGGYVSENAHGNDFDQYGWLLREEQEINNDLVHAMCYYSCP